MNDKLKSAVRDLLYAIRPLRLSPIAEPPAVYEPTKESPLPTEFLGQLDAKAEDLRRFAEEVKSELECLNIKENRPDDEKNESVPESSWVQSMEVTHAHLSRIHRLLCRTETGLADFLSASPPMAEEAPAAATSCKAEAIICDIANLEKVIVEDSRGLLIRLRIPDIPGISEGPEE